MTQFSQPEPFTPGKSPLQARARMEAAGLVQGVGFRPFVSRLASSLDLTGLVANTNAGVTIELEGDPECIRKCIERLSQELPPLARLDRLRVQHLPPAGYKSFSIEESKTTIDLNKPALGATVNIAADVAPCRDCLNELCNPQDRRYRHPFTNCTNCGPRFSIQHTTPFDRQNTSMGRFPMCADCSADYSDKSNRRMHAQAIACPACGPRLSLWNRAGNTLTQGDDALLKTAQAIKDGKIVALKAVGGFQLMVDARNRQAVNCLRQRKHRLDKPFALMLPSLETARTICQLSAAEEAALLGPAAPIVIVQRRAAAAQAEHQIADSVAPDNPWLGIMLPSSPLHYLLMHSLEFAVVATSGNRANEPIVTDELDALERLADIADLFLVHDRPIIHALDDSIVRVIEGRPVTLRLARGLAPLTIRLPAGAPPLLAFGGHLKSAPALVVHDQIVLGAHIGDLDTLSARLRLHQSLDSLCGLHQVSPQAAAHDAHPDYYSTQAARSRPERFVPVQHHVAHLASCLADNELTGPALGVIWDGSGRGDDGSVWGGEFIVVNEAGAHRVASFRSFPLPGGDAAVREPRRSALGILFELDGVQGLNDPSIPSVRGFTKAERALIAQMLAKHVNSPLTSSVGRLFDAVASLTGLIQTTSFEGQAAIKLESIVDDDLPPQIVPNAASRAGQTITIDWEPLIRMLISMTQAGSPASLISATLHHWLANSIVTVAQSVGLESVLLTGGCFQNRFLTEIAIKRLTGAGFTPYWHRHVPPNDGGLAVGQAMWAARTLNNQELVCA